MLTLEENASSGRDQQGASSIPVNPQTLLGRKALAAISTEHGMRISEATLATYACRGGGPAYRLFGSRALYSWGDYLEWAESRLSQPAYSSSEHRVHSRSRTAD